MQEIIKEDQTTVPAENAATRVRAEIQRREVEASALDEVKHRLYEKILDLLQSGVITGLQSADRGLAITSLASSWFDLHSSDLRIIGGNFDAARLKAASEYTLDNYSAENPNGVEMAKLVLMIMLGYPAPTSIGRSHEANAVTPETPQATRTGTNS
jgi:hypothetical protein